MKLLYKLERRFGKYAIRDLMKYIVALYIIGLIFGTLSPYAYNSYLSLDFPSIMKGQVWRLITFIIPISTISGLSIIWTAFKVYIYYSFGNSLENFWGSFRFNLYMFSGILFNFLASWLVYAFTGTNLSPSLDLVCSTLFFAFAAIYPNATIYFNMLIPIKAKYLAWFRGALYLYQIWNLISYGFYWDIIPIIASLANFLIFFFMTRNYKRVSPKEFKRKATFKRKMREAKMQGNVVQMNGRNVITRHKCAVCGRTELDNDQLEFRFCSKCDGNYEYCMDHLFTHEHVKQ